MAGVLNGMRVVEGSAFVAVPLAGMTLAQMGADLTQQQIASSVMIADPLQLFDCCPPSDGAAAVVLGMGAGNLAALLRLNCPSPVPTQARSTVAITITMVSPSGWPGEESNRDTSTEPLIRSDFRQWKILSMFTTCTPPCSTCLDLITKN